jgi:hypothetical protein
VTGTQVSEETAQRIAAALERLAAAAEAQTAASAEVTFPLGPILPKDRPRSRARGDGRHR